MELNYFDICSGGLLPDIMHDILEGALPYEAKLVLQHCIRKGYLSFHMLSQTLDCMELGYMDAANRPSQFTEDVLHSTSRSLGQNGKLLLLDHQYICFTFGCTCDCMCKELCSICSMKCIIAKMFCMLNRVKMQCIL